jgi:hypothetical protein
MTALLVKPLLDLWIFEHGDTESGDDRDGDDDAWSVASADKSRYNVDAPTPESLVCNISRSIANRREHASSRYAKESRSSSQLNVPLTAAAGIFATGSCERCR